MTEKLSPIQTELLSRADSIFAAISSAVSKATDFAAAQIPDIAMQYVAYGRAYSTIVTLAFITMLIAGLFLVIRVAIQNCYKDEDSAGWADSRFGAMVCGVVLSFAGFLGTVVNMSAFLMVWFAPKIWLITELVKLAK